MNRDEHTSAIRVAVIGAGAVGGLVAGFIQAAGHAVTLCVRTPFDRLELGDDTGSRTVPAEIAVDPGALLPFPWVILATKAQDSASAGTWLSRLADAHSTVVVLQNGIDHLERVHPLAPSSRILPALIYAAVEQLSPGRILHHQGRRIIVPEGPAGLAFSRLLEGGGVEVELSPDFTTAAWRKLLGNVPANPVTALTLRRIDVMRDPGIMELAEGLLREAAAAGRAAGARLKDRDVEEVLAAFAGYKDAVGSSMLYDRLAGKSLEHDHITGAVVRAARKHGVPAPLNQALWALLNSLDKGRSS